MLRAINSVESGGVLIQAFYTSICPGYQKNEAQIKMKAMFLPLQVYGEFPRCQGQLTQ